ncbi:formylmethanofuran--tetrahydromethanopterin formyltransferase [archaeon SCG-AAA382B04]|nr:formylmethanofuran--tetrahydromethanopterin formyltransferase [archaeon SCG-AAA382B04]
MFKVNEVPIEDTYCEAFEGVFTRVLLTAKNSKRLKKSAQGSTALPLTVFDESETGVESYLDSDLTPDDRYGAILQFWVNKKSGKEKLEEEFAKRVRQGILVVPGTRVFNWNDFKDKFGTLKKIGHCGDGYEWIEERFGRQVINIPIMMGEFLVEEKIGYDVGVMGGNVWFYCDSYDSGIRAGEAFLDSTKDVEGVVTPFDICSAGSKVETNYPEIGPTTNHPYCPTLKDKIDSSKVPEGVKSIPEVVINGRNEKSVKKAMKEGIKSATSVDGVIKIGAGNFGGNLGRYKIYLKNLF